MDFLAGAVSIQLLDHGTRLWDNTSALSDLGLSKFIVSRQFIAIPVLLVLLSRYCACVMRAVPLLSIVLASFASFCSEEVNKSYMQCSCRH